MPTSNIYIYIYIYIYIIKHNKFFSVIICRLIIKGNFVPKKWPKYSVIIYSPLSRSKPILLSCLELKWRNIQNVLSTLFHINECPGCTIKVSVDPSKNVFHFHFYIFKQTSIVIKLHMFHLQAQYFNRTPPPPFIIYRQLASKFYKISPTVIHFSFHF